jgi:dTDP-4-amino-4,6-dideoxygalactose transaminase
MTKPNSGHGGAPAAEIPLIDLRQQHQALQHKIQAALRQVFDSSVFILGPNVRAFEEEMKAFLDVKHAIAVASGTDALNLSLAALGLKPGDEVLVPSFTYAATSAAVSHLNAVPIFVDSEPAGFNLDPEDAARRITPRTKAIIPVHLYGEAAEMHAIIELAREHNLYVVEDVAQAVGGRWDGRRLGTLGETGCFSFYPTKNLAACGDGGMVTTNDDELADRVQLLRQQADASVLGGQSRTHLAVGYNSRLDEMQAAILRVKLPHLDRWNHFRAQHADQYRRRLREANVLLPVPDRDGSHVYCLFTIRCERRDELRQWLREQRIGCDLYYPLPLHLQKAYRDLGYQEGDLPNAERLCKECLSIPIYPELTSEQVDRVADAILGFVGRRNEIQAEEAVGHGL